MRRQNQEGHDIKTSLGYRVRSRRERRKEGQMGGQTDEGLSRL